MPVTTIADLLQLLTREPGRPRITWYGDGGERVELSGAVLENWVNKTANLLVEEFDAGPGERVLLDLPVHWRTVVWLLAGWRVGACAVVAPSTSADLVVTTEPARRDAPVVAVTLGAMARRFDGRLPPGAVDAASAVMTYGDVLGYAPAVDSGAPALDDGAVTVSHGELLLRATAASDSGPGARVLLTAPAELDAGSVLRAVGVLATGGSLVLVDPATTGAFLADAARRARIVSSEKVDADLLG
ncbi:TIGR03089 family protein [Cellulomonas sp. P5_E12]